MPERPYTVLSCAVSLDGFVGSATEERLVLSNAEDFDRVDEVRAACDAILVGAGTIRGDDPRLAVRSAVRQQERVGQGRSPTPSRVTLTRTGDLDPRARFFACPDAERLVYCDAGAVRRTRERLGGSATVVDAGGPVDLAGVCRDLADRGVGRLMVEGGGTVHTQFLTQDLADELHLVVAPFFVGDPRARRFVDGGSFPWHPGRRARLLETRAIGDVVLMRYALSERCL